MAPRECPPGKILNPATGRCVDENGKIGRQVRGLTPSPSPSESPRECPPGKILNPATGRCVDENGKIGRELRGLAPRRAPSPAPRPQPSVSNVTNQMARLNLASSTNSNIGYKDSLLRVIFEYLTSLAAGSRDPSRGVPNEEGLRYAATFAVKYASAILSKARQMGRSRNLADTLEAAAIANAPSELGTYLRSALKRPGDETQHLTFPGDLNPETRRRLSNLVVYIASEVAELGLATWRGEGRSNVSAVRTGIERDTEYRQVRNALGANRR